MSNIIKFGTSTPIVIKQTVVSGIAGSTPLTTKGDILSYTTEDVRIAVGSNGTVLTADSTEAAGVKWASAGAGGDALTSNGLDQFAATTSAELAGVISNETGSGALVFGTSPTLVTPALGTPSALVGTNITGTAAGLTVGATTGVEAGANVTDTTNVTAAGALMDSEVTNLAQVKSFDSSDYATAAQGTTADSASQPGHTHIASDITDFSATVSSTTSVLINSSKVTNATHTGEVTGSVALTIDKTAISGKSTVTAVGSDYVLIGDTSDSDNLKKVLISDFASAGGALAVSTYDPATISEQLVGLTATQILTNKTIDLTANTVQNLPLFSYALGDETTAQTTGQKISDRVPFDCVITRVYLTASTAPTGSAATVDVEDGGTTILNSVISMSASAFTAEASTGDFTGATNSYTFTKGDLLTVDQDSVGSTIAGAGYKIHFVGYLT